MTILDKAVSAALDAIMGDDEVGDDEMLKAVRAALVAIKEQGDELESQITEASEDPYDVYFSDVISAILAEVKPGAACRTMTRADIDSISRFPPGKPPGWVDEDEA